MNSKTIYRTAAALAAIQLDRPFSARDIARIEACIYQALATYQPDYGPAYDKMKDLAQIANDASADVMPRLSPVAGVEEALDEAGKRIVAAFSPRMPHIDDPAPV